MRARFMIRVRRCGRAADPDSVSSLRCRRPGVPDGQGAVGRAAASDPSPGGVLADHLVLAAGTGVTRL